MTSTNDSLGTGRMVTVPLSPGAGAPPAPSRSHLRQRETASSNEQYEDYSALALAGDLPTSVIALHHSNNNHTGARNGNDLCVDNANTGRPWRGRHLPGEKRNGRGSHDADGSETPSHKVDGVSPRRLGGAILLLILVIGSQVNRSGVRRRSSAPPVSGGEVAGRLAAPGTAYRGTTWHNGRTVAVDTLGETRFARCDVHTVVSEDGKSIINDWLFLEEVPAVNVVVQTLEGHFVVFRQQKYAIPGDTLAPVGGFIDAGESPLAAAKREVLEELGLGSRWTVRAVKEHSNRQAGNPRRALDVATVAGIIAQNANPPVHDLYGLLDGQQRQVPTSELDTDWVFLGKYRTAANRGGGFLYSYLLTNAVPMVPEGGTVRYQGTGDGEAQEILHLEEDEVMEALSEGRFQEVKWAATFSLAMLHLKRGGNK